MASQVDPQIAHSPTNAITAVSRRWAGGTDGGMRLSRGAWVGTVFGVVEMGLGPAMIAPCSIDLLHNIAIDLYGVK
jgi:hypothetical protein